MGGHMEAVIAVMNASHFTPWNQWRTVARSRSILDGPPEGNRPVWRALVTGVFSPRQFDPRGEGFPTCLLSASPCRINREAEDPLREDHGPR